MLVYRILLLMVAICLFVFSREKLNFTAIFQLSLNGWFIWLVWLTLVFHMLYRLIPNKRISIGARKHYACSYRAAIPNGSGPENIQISPEQLHKGALLCALGWFIISAAVVIALYFFNMLTPATIITIALTYAAFDVVFILFLCPLRLFFMRNRCCVVCRIYNWDYFMICAPLIVYPHFFSLSLFLLSAAVLLRWEIALRKNPHFFLKEYNVNLSCESCEDKLCRYNYKSGRAL